MTVAFFYSFLPSTEDRARRRCYCNARRPVATANVMEKIVSLCKRRGFVYPASEIYGGLNGFWDYGPLGVLLKNNIRDSWWRNMVDDPADRPGRAPDRHGRHRHRRSSRIPKTWVASGHVGGLQRPDGGRPRDQAALPRRPRRRCTACSARTARARSAVRRAAGRRRARVASARRRSSAKTGGGKSSARLRRRRAVHQAAAGRSTASHRPRTRKTPGTLTEPRAFNLMFEHLRRRDPGARNQGVPPPRDRAGHLPQLQEHRRHDAREGAVRRRADRQELPQRGHAAELHLPLARVRADGDGVVLPPGRGAQVVRVLEGRADDVVAVAGREARRTSASASTSRTSSRHYSKMTVDIEYKYPFTAPDFGELEGIAHRGRLRPHAAPAALRAEAGLLRPGAPAQAEGAGASRRGDQGQEPLHPQRDRAGQRADARGARAAVRGVHATTRTGRASVYMKFDAADGADQGGHLPAGEQGRHAGGRGEAVPGPAQRLHVRVRRRSSRSASATPAWTRSARRSASRSTARRCKDQTVTVRERDTLKQERIAIDKVLPYLSERLGA